MAHRARTPHREFPATIPVLLRHLYDCGETLRRRLLLGSMKKNTRNLKRRTLDRLNKETVRKLTGDELEEVPGGQVNCSWGGFGSMNGQSCNTCNIGL